MNEFDMLVFIGSSELERAEMDHDLQTWQEQENQEFEALVELGYLPHGCEACGMVHDAREACC